ncbi:MAG TPA: hypothetical protein VHT49_01575 [Acidimicrobiales bacterium]|nr:hypothetical protein [Acidimicrobiales bacterium]
MTAANDLVLVIGILVLALDAASVIRLLIVPRPASSLLTLPMVWMRSGFRHLSQLAKTYPGKDRILSVSEPVALMVLLGTWLATAVLGYALVIWGLGGATVSRAFLEAGASVSTLGFVHGDSGGYQAIDFFAGATGMVLVALQIAYLPSLYGAYNRRETFVTLLESRAGAPAWGPEILLRHQLVGTIGNLPALYAEWERWGADVAESHTSYPPLMYLRSPRPQNSWIISLVAVMDSAAISLAVNPEGAPIEARMCLRMGFTCLRDIARVVNIPYDPDPNPDDPIELPREEFEAAYNHLRENGYPTPRPMDEAWNHFRGWRVNYEAVAYALATKLDAPPARWTGPRRTFRGESLSPPRPVDRQPGGAPPKIVFPKLS